MIIRPRRLRTSGIIRDMVAETRLNQSMLIQPYFVLKGENKSEEISAMPGIKRFTSDLLIKEVEELLKKGLNKILLFGVGEEKADDGHTSFDESSVIPSTVKKFKQEFGDEIFIITDVCLCAYTTHGHCGILENGYIQNDKSLEVLKRMAVAHAASGADMVSPSDMMDGRVAAIRNSLDKNNFTETKIMSYAVKYASAYYGPFREAAGSAPGEGDRKSYQMDYRNINEALKEAMIDETEGADILMVKPALAYLDVIARVKEITTLPVACYNVSAEYSMIKNAADKGLISEREIVIENMYSFARAGANIIISYHTADILKNNWI
jgi:porphobilinogen synthase